MLIHSAEVHSAIHYSRAEEVSRGPDNHAGLYKSVSMPKLNDSTIWSKVIVIADMCSNCWWTFVARKRHADWLTYILSVQPAKNGQWFVYILISCQIWNLPPPWGPLCFFLPTPFLVQKFIYFLLGQRQQNSLLISCPAHQKTVAWFWQCAKPEAHKYSIKTEPRIRPSQHNDKDDLNYDKF